MDNSMNASEMDKLLEHFIQSCFPTNYGEASWGVEINVLRQLTGQHLEKAKKAILDGLVKEPASRPTSAVLAIELLEAIPLLQNWLQAIRSDETRSHKWSSAQGQLAYTLYELTKDETYIPNLIEAVRKAEYDEFDNSVYMLGKVPLSSDGMLAVWQRYKRGKVRKNSEYWRDQCVNFLKEKIKHPIGENFVTTLPEEDRKELFELISENKKQRIDRNLRLERYVRGRDRYDKADLNKFDEYTKIGGPPIKGLTLKAIWRGHTDIINSLAWSPDGRYLASTSNDESIMIWHFDQNECVKILIREKKYSYSNYWPKRALWVDNGRKLASTYDYYSTLDEDINGVAIWDLSSETIISPLRKPGKDSSYVRNLVCSPEGKFLIVSYCGYEDNTVFLIDPATSGRKRILEEYAGGFETISLSPDGKMIGAGYRESDDKDITHEIIVFDLDTQKMVNRLTGHLGYINQLCWMSKQPILISASSDNTIGIWDLDRCQRVSLLEGHRDIVSNLSLSADGELLVSKCSGDHTIQIWSTRTWKTLMILRELDGHGDTIAFHPTLPILATVYRDETQEKAFRHDLNSIRIWEFDNKEFLDNPPFWDSFME